MTTYIAHWQRASPANIFNTGHILNGTTYTNYTTPTSSIVTSPTLTDTTVYNTVTYHAYSQGYTLPAGTWVVSGYYNIATAYGAPYKITSGLYDINSTFQVDLGAVVPQVNGNQNPLNPPSPFTLSQPTTLYILYGTTNPNILPNITCSDNVLETYVQFKLVPGAPVITNVLPASRTTSYVYFTQPNPASVTNYCYTLPPAATFTTLSPAQSTSPIIIDTSGQPYGGFCYIRIAGINSNGTGAESATYFFYNYSIPSAPSITGWSLLNLSSISVSFSAPTSDGGLTITDYYYSLNSGTFVSIGSTSSPFTISGLTTNTAYTVVLKAYNANGQGNPSSTLSITQINASAPVINSAIVNSSSQLVLSVTPPSIFSDTSYTLSNYQYSFNGGGFVVLSPAQTSSTITISGLTFGSSNQIIVQALVSQNPGFASPSSNTVVPTVPPAPSSISLTSLNSTQSNINFTQSTISGTPAITNYSYSINGTTFYSTGSTTSPIAITNSTSGLTSGNSYTLSLRAIYTSGYSLGTSSSFTFYNGPTQPTNVSWQQVNSSSITVSFTAPSSNGGNTITNYQYSLNNGSTFTALSPADAVSPITIAGLATNTAYTLVIRAVNAFGTGDSSSSISITQINLAPPTITSVTGNGSGPLSIAFTAPSSTGGYTVTNYSYTLAGSGGTFTTLSPAQTSSPLSISGIAYTSGSVVGIKAITSYETSISSNTMLVSGIPAPTTQVLDWNWLFVSNDANGLVIKWQLVSGSGYWSGNSGSTSPTGPIVTSPTLNLSYVGGGYKNYAYIQGYTIPSGNYYCTVYSYFGSSTTVENVFLSDISQNSILTLGGVGHGSSYTQSFPATIGTTTTCYLNFSPQYSSGTPTITATGELKVTLQGAPPAPTNISVTPLTTTTSSISFTQPAGTAVTDYQYSIGGSNWYSTGSTTSPITINNSSPIAFTVGTSYTLYLRGMFAGGGGNVGSTTFTFAGYATAPTNISWQQASTTSITVTFTAPSTDGGYTITNYQYSLNNGSTFAALSPADAVSPITITGLSINTAYTLVLRAVTSLGTGASSTSTSITQINSSAPVITGAAIDGSNNVVVTFTAPQYTGGYTITNYSYSINNGSSYTAFNGPQTASPLIIGGVTFTYSNTLLIKAITSYESSGGPASNSLSTPSAPTNVSAVYNPVSYSYLINISFTAPSSNGGLNLTNYYYSFNDSAFIDSGTTSTSFSIDGSNYFDSNIIVVQAMNSLGASAGSNPFYLYITIPSPPPTITSASVATNGQLTINFNQTNYSGGLYVTGLTFYIGSQNSFQNGNTSPVIQIPPWSYESNQLYLAFYTFVGPGTLSSPFTLNITVPGAPTLNSAVVASNGNLTLTFTAGSAGGNSMSIINYQYSTNNGSTYTSFSPASVTSPYVVTGASYSVGSIVKIKALNTIGASAESNAITLSITTPTQPLSVGATIDANGTLNITFTAPTSDGGLNITNYYYSLDGTTYFSSGQTSSPIAITYSTSIPYTATNNIYLKAYNSIGQGAASSPAVTINLTTPTAPTITSVSVNSSNGVITLGYNAPVSNGGIPIINYKYQLNNTGSYISINSTSTYLIISGATFNPTSNSIRLEAVNKVGDGSPSASFSVPISVPSAPTSVSGTISSATGYLTISATTPSNGGLAITNYYVSFNGGTLYALNTTTFPAVYTNTATIPYNQTTSFRLYATNAIGNGPASSAATFTTSVPSAPTIISQYDSLNLANTINLIIQAPSSNGGLTITNYRYSLDNGTTWTTFSPAQNGTTTLVVMGGPPQTVTNVLVIGGLTERATYSLIIQAINLGGTSPSSNMLYFKFMCFLEGTKILCYDVDTQQEVYRCVETLRKGDLVKTLTSGYKAVDTIGTSKIYNPGNKIRSDNRLYRCSKDDYPSLFEDLVITGCHSILVGSMSKQEMMDLIELQGKVYTTEGKYRITARVDQRTSTYEKEGLFNIWHFALENHDLYSNYGVYANGLLVETSSKRMMNECSGMNLL